MQSARKIHFSYFIKSKSPCDNPSLGICQRFLYLFFACGQFCHTQLGTWATVTSFALGQHASSKPVGLELNSHSFPGRWACLPGNGRREEERGRREQHTFPLSYHSTERERGCICPLPKPGLRAPLAPGSGLLHCAPEINTVSGVYPGGTQ